MPSPSERIPSLDLADFRAFRAVADLKSQALAARKLGVHSSTISRRIERMKQNYGGDIFVNCASGELTERGRTVLAAVTTCLATLEKLDEELANHKPVLRVGFNRILTPLLEIALSDAATRNDHLHEYDIRLYEQTSSNQLRALKQRELDIALCYAQDGNVTGAGLQAYLIHESPYALVIPERAWVAGEVCHETLRGLHYAHVRRRSVAVAGERWLEKHGIVPTQRSAHDMASEILALVASGRSYSFLPELWAVSARSQARFVPLEKLGASARVVSYTHSDQRALARALRDRVVAALPALGNSR